jgi:hypothetical protein
VGCKLTSRHLRGADDRNQRGGVTFLLRHTTLSPPSTVTPQVDLLCINRQAMSLFSSKVISMAPRKATQAAATNRAMRGTRKTYTNSTKPNLAPTVTSSIGKTKGVDGPDISAYPPPKHLKVPSGLTPQQVCTQFNRYTLTASVDQNSCRMSQ